MEEIHETAKAYYNNLTENRKQKANKMFLSMDLDGDGRISISEYVEMSGKMGFKFCNNPNFFVELDRDGDGNLDFEEFMSLYYLIKSDRLVFCDEKKNTFDLCSSCFNGKNFRHNHATFLDNFALLRCMAVSCTHAKLRGYSQLEQSSGRLKSSTSRLPSEGSGSTSFDEVKQTEEAILAVEFGVSVAKSIVEISNSGCSVM